MSDAPKCSSCEPTWTCRPSQSGTRRTSSSASSGGRPNFEPWCAVFTASWVSASIPGVTRTRKRSAPAARAPVELVERVEDDQRPGVGCAAQQLILLVVAVDDEPLAIEPGAQRERELACGGDVGAEALLGEQPQHRDRRERLRPVRDQRIRGGRAVRACLVAQRHLVVDDERRPELGRASSVARHTAEASPPSSIDAPFGQQVEHSGTSGIVAEAMLALLADLAWRRPRRILAGSILLAVCAAVFGASTPSRLRSSDNDFQDKGSESYRTLQLLSQRTGVLPGPSIVVVASRGRREWPPSGSGAAVRRRACSRAPPSPGRARARDRVVYLRDGATPRRC